MLEKLQKLHLTTMELGDSAYAKGARETAAYMLELWELNELEKIAEVR